MGQKFSGFSKDTFAFLSGLENNNSKDWFEANRARYEAHWKSPAFDLIDALSDPMAALDPSLKAEARVNGTVRRINRDVRFSKNKAPYHARLHLIFWAGSHPNRSPALHFVLTPTSFGYGAGVFGLDAAALKSYRNRIINPVERTALLHAIAEGEKTGSTFGEPDLKRLPAGYEAEGNWEHLLRRKSFVMRTFRDREPPDWLFNDRCVPEMLKLTRGLMPLIRWLNV